MSPRMKVLPQLLGLLGHIHHACKKQSPEYMFAMFALFSQLAQEARVRLPKTHLSFPHVGFALQ